ncbi:MAG: hypothetical protein LUQ25_05625, partial [Methanoregulaceae archaeon]|nr:hypothetical protein [Methanoregulaceae archaeon]
MRAIVPVTLGVLVWALLLPAVSGMVVSTGNATVTAQGEVRDVPLTLDEVPEGLLGYVITISLSRPEVAEIISVEFPDWAPPDYTYNTTLPADSVRLAAADMDHVVGPGHSSVLLATLRLRGDTPGTSPIGISVTRIEKDDGEYPMPDLSHGTFTVPGEPAPGVIVLSPGWNLVSVPRRLVEGHRTAAEVFGGVNTGGHSLFTFDTSSHEWKQVTGEDALKPLDATWIYSVSETNVPLSFAGPVWQLPEKDLFQGWNLVGFSDITPAPAKRVLSSVEAGWTTVIGFDATIQRYEASIVRGGSGTHSDENPMFPGKAYWLF